MAASSPTSGAGAPVTNLPGLVENRLAWRHHQSRQGRFYRNRTRKQLEHRKIRVPRCLVPPTKARCRSDPCIPPLCIVDWGHHRPYATGLGRYKNRRGQSSLTRYDRSRDSRNESASAPLASLLMARGKLVALLSGAEAEIQD